MRYVLEVFDEAKEPHKTTAEYYGYAALLMGTAPALLNRTLAKSLWHLGAAFAHKQFKFYFDARGMPVGMVTWAFLAPDVEDRFLSGDDPQLHLSEWNEGDSPWIIDFVAPYGNLKHILRDLRDTVFAAHDGVIYSRRRKGAVVTKQIQASPFSYFFRNRRNAS
ncbi:toxin-activating lysine-acyltransferase [Massilia sp. GER05]|jgi:hemolysin-activating ACP:hemolysin acyltransferase|uniref:toxin-activating lysine-acyltransferase n=1 Tax=Massilia sp. GER05 TaxID=3394605 RepID=UPI003F862986